MSLKNKTMTLKDFIQTCFIDELGEIVERYPYQAFMIMSAGIEFLGAHVNNTNSSSLNATSKGKSKQTFESAIKQIPALKKYTRLLKKYRLYQTLRCNMLHAAVPGLKITLSSKDEEKHLKELKLGESKRINLRCEDLYADFKAACEWTIAKLSEEHKAEVDFLSVPGD
jgi:hypothetical protein